MKIFHHALELAIQKTPAVLITVIDVQGSVPRQPGARLLVAPQGLVAGTVGGGRLEYEAINQALEICKNNQSQCFKRHLVRDLGMCCGGSMELYIEPVSPHLDMFKQLLIYMEQRQPVKITTPLNGDDKIIEPIDIDAYFPAYMAHENFYETIMPSPRLFLFGYGHINKAVGKLAAEVGFFPVVCDDGETENVESLPSWVEQYCDSFDISYLHKQNIIIDSHDYVVIATRDHAIDQDIVEQVSNIEHVAYVGLIGSKGKRRRFKNRLDVKGTVPERFWNQLKSPMGIIEAESVNEIAVSIVAELIEVRNQYRDCTNTVAAKTR